MAIGHRWKKKGMIEIINGFYIQFSIDLLLERSINNLLWTSSIEYITFKGGTFFSDAVVQPRP